MKGKLPLLKINATNPDPDAQPLLGRQSVLNGENPQCHWNGPVLTFSLSGAFFRPSQTIIMQLTQHYMISQYPYCAVATVV